MLVALIVIAVSLSVMVPAPSWLGWYTLAFILLFDSAYAWSCEPSKSFQQRSATHTSQDLAAPGTVLLILNASGSDLHMLMLPCWCDSIRQALAQGA